MVCRKKRGKRFINVGFFFYSCGVAQDYEHDNGHQCPVTDAVK